MKYIILSIILLFVLLIINKFILKIKNVNNLLFIILIFSFANINIYLGLILTILYLYIKKNSINENFTNKKEKSKDKLTNKDDDEFNKQFEDMNNILEKNKDKGFNDNYIDNTLDYSLLNEFDNLNADEKKKLLYSSLFKGSMHELKSDTNSYIGTLEKSIDKLQKEFDENINNLEKK